jgi:hypothetical protein
MVVRFGHLLPFLAMVQSDESFAGGTAQPSIEELLRDNDMDADDMGAAEVLEFLSSRARGGGELQFDTLFTRDTVVGIAALRHLLEPIAQLTTLLQSESVPTLPLCANWIHQLVSVYEHLAADDSVNETTRSGAQFMGDSVRSATRFGPLFDRANPALCAAALDPRFGHLPFVSDDVRDRVWQALLQDAKNVIPVPQSASMAASPTSTGCNAFSYDISRRRPRDAVMPESMDDIFSQFIESHPQLDVDENLSTSSSSSVSAAQTEHWKQLESALVELRSLMESQSFRTFIAAQPPKSAAEYWRRFIGTQFSNNTTTHLTPAILKPLIQGYCGGTASSSASESAFSVAGAVKSKTRSRLSPEHLRMETLICRNLDLFESSKELVCETILPK